MKKIFFPGCRVKAGYPNGSKKLKEYMLTRYHLEAVGCCKEDYGLLEEGNKAVLICNNCRVELGNLIGDIDVEFVYELIDQDDTFPFPNYQGKSFILQDCNYGYKGHNIEKTVRSLLTKMNINYIELDPAKKVLVDMSRKEHRELVSNNAATFEKKEVITYCAICNLAYKNANKDTHLLLDLLFDCID